MIENPRRKEVHHPLTSLPPSLFSSYIKGMVGENVPSAHVEPSMASGARRSAFVVQVSRPAPTRQSTSLSCCILLLLSPSPLLHVFHPLSLSSPPSCSFTKEKILEEYKPDEKSCAFVVTSPTDGSSAVFQAESDEDILLFFPPLPSSLLSSLSPLPLSSLFSLTPQTDAPVAERHSVPKDHHRRED